MKKLLLKGGIRETLSREQMKKIGGGYIFCEDPDFNPLADHGPDNGPCDYGCYNIWYCNVPSGENEGCYELGLMSCLTAHNICLSLSYGGNLVSANSDCSE